MFVSLHLNMLYACLNKIERCVELKIKDQYLSCEDQSTQEFIQVHIQDSTVVVYLSSFIALEPGK